MPDSSHSLPEDLLEVQEHYAAAEPISLFTFARELFEQFKRWLVAWYEQLLEQWLAQALGPAYGSDNQFEQRCCPDCGARRARRKGWRSRQVALPVWGTIRLERPYVACKACGRSWAPLDRMIGLEPRRTYMWQSLERPLRALFSGSYRQAARSYPEAPSAMTLWRRINRQQPPLPGMCTGSEGLVIADSTRIPGRTPSGQLSISVAHLVRPARGTGARPRLDRVPIASVAAGEQALKDRLGPQPIDQLLHDGKTAFGAVAARPARCRWHVAYTMKYFLYQDNISGRTNKTLCRAFRTLLQEVARSPARAREKLRAWIDRHQAQAPRTTGHIERALPELVRPFEQPAAFPIVSTSPIEREMRSINKRMENGGTWSPSGGDAFLRHLQVFRHRPERYNKWLHYRQTAAWNDRMSQT